MAADDQFKSEQKGLLTQLTALSVMVLLVGQIAVAWFALNGFEKELEPQLYQKANAVGHSIVERFTYATAELQIAPEDLVGVDPYFEDILAHNPDIAYLAYESSDGELLFVRGFSPNMMNTLISELPDNPYGAVNFEKQIEGFVDGVFPVWAYDGTTSRIHVGVRSEHIRNQLAEILLELLIVIAISWLVTFELLSFFMGTHVLEPLAQIRNIISNGAAGVFTNRLTARSRDEVGMLTLSLNRMLNSLQNRYNDFLYEVRDLKAAQIDDRISEKISTVHRKITSQYRLSSGKQLRLTSASQIRVPLFLFIFSEELSRSFLPLFVTRYAPADMMISQDLLVGLPITLFMLAATIATPIGGGLVDRIGVQRVFVAGIVIALMGFIGNFLTQTYYDLVAYRILTGIGYGLVFIASEGWVTSNAREHNRAQSTGVFVSAVFAGIVCGPSIGGIIADRIGFEATFLISAVLAIASGTIVYQIFRQSTLPKRPAYRRLTLSRSDWMKLMRDWRFVAVSLLAAAPGKAMVAGFIVYLVPLYLNELGHSPSSIGRIMMLYGLVTICLVYVTAKHADQSGRYLSIIATGGLIAGLGCVASIADTALGGESNAIIVAILALGVGHALTLTSQNSIIQQVAERYREDIGKASVTSAYRLVERIGMIVGPLVAVGLVAMYGFRGAVIAFGCILIVLTIAFVATMLVASRKSGLQES